MAKKKAKKQALKDDGIDLQHDTSAVNEIPSSAGRPQRPSVSPYAELPVELGVGSDGMTYYVPRHLLPLEWIKTGLEKRLSLDKIDKETGHTLVHYLYSKEYETLDIVAESPLAELCVEFTRALLVFIMTVRYNGLTDLRNLAISQMQDLGAKLDICEVLGAIKDHFSKLESHSWIHEYVRERVTVAFAKDITVFKSTALLQSIGDADYIKFVMGCVMDSYDERVSRMAEAEKVLSQELDKHRRGVHTPRPENPMANGETVQEDFSLPDADMDLGECHEQRAAKQSELLNEDLEMAVCSSPGYLSSITGEELSSSNVSLVDYPHEPSQNLLHIDELDRPSSQVETGSEQHKPSRTSVEIESNAGSGEAAIDTDGALAVETKHFSPKRMIEPGDIPQPCSLQAEHMLEEKMWRDCELCRAMLLKIAIQLGQVV